MFVAAISSKDIRGRCTLGSSTSHPRRCHNRRAHGSSSSTSTRRDFRSHNSRDRNINSATPGAAGREHLTISSPTPGAAGEDHLPNSGEKEHIISGDHNIGEEISHTSSAPDNHARTNAAASYICGIIFGSLCRAVRHSPPSSLNITRQRWTFKLSNLQASAATRQLRTYPADATAAQICRINSTSAGASLGLRLELLLRVIPCSTGTVRAFSRVYEFGFD